MLRIEMIETSARPAWQLSTDLPNWPDPGSPIWGNVKIFLRRSLLPGSQIMSSAGWHLRCSTRQESNQLALRCVPVLLKVDLSLARAVSYMDAERSLPGCKIPSERCPRRDNARARRPERESMSLARLTTRRYVPLSQM